MFRRNLGTPEEVAEQNRQLAGMCPRDYPPWLGIDQEGGRVSRLGSPVLKLPPMAELGRIDDPSLTLEAAELLGRQLGALGFSVDFAPVLDVHTNPDNPVIGDRSFGSTPEIVVRHAAAFAEGLGRAGIVACGKHFPGHGDTDLDSHHALPHVRHELARLEGVELAPFRALSRRLPAMMSSHVVFEAIDPTAPATLSATLLQDWLRGKLGFQGVVFSDDMEMAAIARQTDAGDTAVAAIEAGCDVLLVCSEVERWQQVHAALTRRAERDAAFAGRLRSAVERSLAVRRAHPPRPAADDDLTRALRVSEVQRLEERIADAKRALDE